MLCTESFTNKIHLKEHLKKMHGHSGVRSFQCGQCGKTFLANSTLKNHVLQTMCCKCTQRFARTSVHAAAKDLLQQRTAQNTNGFAEFNGLAEVCDRMLAWNVTKSFAY